MEQVQRVFLRTTERKSFANCRQQWWWSFVDCWVANQQRPALVFGDLCHQSLAIWYKPGRVRGIHPAKSFEKLYAKMVAEGGEEFDVFEDDEKVDALELGIAMMKNYVDRWGNDDHINVISSELHFEVDVYDKNGRYMFTYAGSFDLAYEDLNAGQFGLIETKTAASISTRFLSMDEQAGSYWVFAPLVLQHLGKIPQGKDIDFILYNFLRKAFEDTRPVDNLGRRLNKPTKKELAEFGDDYRGSPSKRQPPALFIRQKVYRDTVDRENLLYRARAQSWEMGRVKKGLSPLYKNPGMSYPNQQCLGCQFGDVCELHETGREWEELARLTMGKWDPYEDHRHSIPTLAPAIGPTLGTVVVKQVKTRKKAS